VNYRLFLINSTLTISILAARINADGKMAIDGKIVLQVKEYLFARAAYLIIPVKSAYSCTFIFHKKCD
jgi:hypothetical protein